MLSMGKANGFSLIESAVVILFISLAMVPIISSMGGVNDNEASLYSGNVSSMTAHKSKLTYAAQSIMERAIAGERDQTTTGIGFDSQLLFPDGDSTVIGTTQTVNKREFYSGTGREYNQPITFKWVVRDLSHRVDEDGNLIGWDNSTVSQANAESVAPAGNRVISAALELYENPGDATPIMTLPTYFYRSTCTAGVCGGATLEKTGISIVLDISGSMVAAQSTHIGTIQPAGFPAGLLGSPFLRNRYNMLGNSPHPAIRISDIFDDTTLDLTYALPFGNEDPNTPFTEQYIQPGSNPVSSELNFPNQCDNPTSNPGSKRRYFTPRIENTAPSVGWVSLGGGAWGNLFNPTSKSATQVIARLCGNANNSDPGENLTRNNFANWNTMINTNMSRIEGARNAILSMLVTLEENQFLATYMKMGLVTFSDGANMQVTLEEAQIPPGPSTVTESKFVNMRYAAAMINRDGTNNNSEILAGGNTHMLAGLRLAANDLYQDTDISSRLIIAIGDGAVNSGSQNSPAPPPSCSGNVADFGSDVGDGSYTNGSVSAGGETITVFTVGVIGFNVNTMRCLAEQTPNGQFFAINSVADMQPIFDQVAFQIERLVLNSMVSRYNLPIAG